MIRLFEQDRMEDGRNSSKGNQLKWRKGDLWYKADYTGYEGLSEYVVSALLSFTSLQETEYVVYETEQILYGRQQFHGCRSKNFLPPGWQLITLERLFQQQFARSLYREIYQIDGVKDRILFTVEQIERITGIQKFGRYLAKLMTIDAMFFNEDRHMHNIALLMDPQGRYVPAPMFDHGACLLSDTTMDYPLDGDIYELMDTVRSKTFSYSFDEQLDAAEELFGETVHFYYTKNDVAQILAQETIYPETVKNRVMTILYDRMRSYPYLFHTKPGLGHSERKAAVC